MLNKMDRDKLVHDFPRKLEDIRRSQAEFDEELLYIETWIDRLMDLVDSANRDPGRARPLEPAAAPGPVDERMHVPEDDFSAHLEKLLEGSLEHLGDRISQDIFNMLKELKQTTGVAREAKIKELKEVAGPELVDLSRLFLRGKLESNIGEMRVEEQEAEGIDKSLEKLREMKGGKAGGTGDKKAK